MIVVHIRKAYTVSKLLKTQPTKAEVMEISNYAVVAT